MESKRTSFTLDGFKKEKIPKILYKKMLDWYLVNKDKAVNEVSLQPGILEIIRNVYKSELNTKIVHLESDKKLLYEFNNIMFKICSKWSNQSDLIKTHTYGIRIYEHGDIIKPHTDRPNTNVVGVICSIDQEDMKEPWGLQIKDNSGWLHEIFLEPGEMLLYESDILEHGRMHPLNGKSYANMFIHFKPKNYKYNTPPLELKSII